VQTELVSDVAVRGFRMVDERCVTSHSALTIDGVLGRPTSTAFL